MGKGSCELCGQTGQLNPLEVHHIVPDDITGQPGIRPSATADLCQNCHREAHQWYTKKVSTTFYDPRSKRFKPRPPAEMVREYEAAYRVFATYRQKLHNRA